MHDFNNSQSYALPKLQEMSQIPLSYHPSVGFLSCPVFGGWFPQLKRKEVSCQHKIFYFTNG